MGDPKQRDAQDVPDPAGREAIAGGGVVEGADGAADDGGEPEGPPAWVTEPGTSKLAPRWWLKTLAFALVLIGFGGWGLYDALVVYPERGINDAEFKQLEYLRAWSISASSSDATVADPKGEYERLETMAREQASRVSPYEARRLEWLRSLAKVARLEPQYTRIESPQTTLRELETRWATRKPPKPLSAYDIPAQWLFVALGFSLGPWLLFKLVKVAGKRYRWEPEGQRLTLPGNITLAAADLEDVDKRRWDKFIVFLKDKEGREHKIDLYHYTQPVEDWVLAMEKTRFPERAKEDDESGTDQDSDSPDGDGDGGSDGGGGGGGDD